MIIGIVGSRRRHDEQAYYSLMAKLGWLTHNFGKVTKIVTGDCTRGGDYFARKIAKEHNIELEVKSKNIPRGWLPYHEFVQECYKRNEKIAKEPLDYLIAIISPDRTGGTENTIKHFKKYHEDWEKKLILL